MRRSGNSAIMLISAAALLAGCSSEPAPSSSPESAAAPPAATPPATVAAAPAAAPVPAAAMPAGDAVRGQSVFNQCRACHAIEPGRNGIGPSLAGVVGREAGAVPGFAYSPANKNSHLRWDTQTLFTYLAAPATTIPGTRMTFILPDAQRRADVIAYLETL